jgi:hypothetical protein
MDCERMGSIWTVKVRGSLWTVNVWVTMVVSNVVWDPSDE